MEQRKYISILGDDRSTFEGVTPKIGSFYSPSYVSYAGFATPEGTWWMQLIHRLGGQLLVNNSFAGSHISCAGNYAACLPGRIRSLATEAAAPDLVLVCTGLNDVAHRVDLGAFRRDCRDMVQKLAAQYPAAQIWVGTITVGKPSQGPGTWTPPPWRTGQTTTPCSASAWRRPALPSTWRTSPPSTGATRPSTAPTPTGRAWSPLPTVGTRPWQGRCPQKAEDGPGRITAGVSSQFRNQMDKRPAGTRPRAGWLFWGKGCSPVHLPCASG